MDLFYLMINLVYGTYGYILLFYFKLGVGYIWIYIVILF